METKIKPNNVHIGRKISRLRELRGMKQDNLAFELGVSQQTISKIEQSEEVEDSTLEKIAVILGVKVEAIKNFSEEAVFNIIGNTYHDNSASLNYQCSFNPFDKIVELYNDKITLMERLLESEREKMEFFRKGKNS